MLANTYSFPFLILYTFLYFVASDSYFSIYYFFFQGISFFVFYLSIGQGRVFLLFLLEPHELVQATYAPLPPPSPSLHSPPLVTYVPPTFPPPHKLVQDSTSIPPPPPLSSTGWCSC